jgi:hypothetical protein
MRLRSDTFWLGLRVLTVGLALGLAAACGSEPSPTDGGDESTPPDTSTLSFQRFEVIGWSAEGTIRTGLEMHWDLEFHSSTGRDCRINRYTLADADQQILYDEVDPIPAIVEDGGILTDKNRFIEIDGATPTGTYHFSVLFETGRRSVIDGVVDWMGPLSTGQLDTTFFVN